MTPREPIAWVRTNGNVIVRDWGVGDYCSLSEFTPTGNQVARLTDLHGIDAVPLVPATDLDDANLRIERMKHELQLMYAADLEKPNGVVGRRVAEWLIAEARWESDAEAAEQDRQSQTVKGVHIRDTEGRS